MCFNILDQEPKAIRHIIDHYKIAKTYIVYSQE